MRLVTGLRATARKGDIRVLRQGSAAAAAKSMAVMDGRRARLPALDPRPRVGRLQARGMLALRFAVVGWRLGGARDRLADRRALIARRRAR